MVLGEESVMGGEIFGARAGFEWEGKGEERVHW